MALVIQSLYGTPLEELVWLELQKEFWLWNLDILIKLRFRLGLALTSELPHPNELLYLAFGFFTGSFRVLKDSYPRGTYTKFLPIPSLAKAQVRRPAMPIPPPISSVFSSKPAESFPRARADSVSKRERQKTFDLERLVALLPLPQVPFLRQEKA